MDSDFASCLFEKKAVGLLKHDCTCQLSYWNGSIKLTFTQASFVIIASFCESHIMLKKAFISCFCVFLVSVGGGASDAPHVKHDRNPKPSVDKTALWYSLIGICSHFYSYTKVISDLLVKVIVICCRFTSSHIITHVSVRSSDEQSVEQTEAPVLNMHECCTLCSGCIGVNDFLLSHYHKLWFIAIVARLQQDTITQSSGV